MLTALLGATVLAPGALAGPLPTLNVALSVNASSCSTIVLTARVDWARVRLTASQGYVVEWFAVGSFSQTLGSSAFDPGKRAGKRHGTASATFTRDGFLDSEIYGGSDYSASLRLVATGQVVATSNQVPIPECVPR
jgi:hypothetical protein